MYFFLSWVIALFWPLVAFWLFSPLTCCVYVFFSMFCENKDMMMMMNGKIKLRFKEPADYREVPVQASKIILPSNNVLFLLPFLLLTATSD